MRMSRFSLTKTYLDCQTAAGDSIVCYASLLQLDKLRFHHASWLHLDPEGKTHKRQTFIRGRMPEQKDGIISWDCPALGVLGQWSREHPPLPPQLLYKQEERELVWRCLQPRSQVSLQLGKFKYQGIGYAEQLHMTIPPWKLPIETLHWGRFLGEQGSSCVWILWEGIHPIILFLDQQGRLLTENILAAKDGSALDLGNSSLTFDRKHILREGEIGQTVLKAFPAFAKAMLPPSILHLKERKWAGEATLATPAGVEHGLSIHEIIHFAPSES